MPTITGNRKLKKDHPRTQFIGIGTGSRPGHPGDPILGCQIIKKIKQQRKSSPATPKGKVIATPTNPVAKKVAPITKGGPGPAPAKPHILSTGIGRIVLLVILLALVIHFVRK